MDKHGQGTHCTKMGADSLAENIPNAQNFSAQFVPSPCIALVLFLGSPCLATTTINSFFKGRACLLLGIHCEIFVSLGLYYLQYCLLDLLFIILLSNWINLRRNLCCSYKRVDLLTFFIFKDENSLYGMSILGSIPTGVYVVQNTGSGYSLKTLNAYHA